MWGQPKQATSATMAMIYVTVGALMTIWTVITYLYLNKNNGSDMAYLWCHGFLATGIVLVVLGLAVGRIGANARQAEVAALPQTPIVNAPAVAAPTAPQPTTTPPAEPNNGTVQAASPMTAGTAGVRKV